MCKHIWLVFICFIIAACSPSSTQSTTTAIATYAQAETAAPTLTFTVTPTLTFTPTPTSTATNTPTPYPIVWGGYRENQLVAYKSLNKQGCYYRGDIGVSWLNGFSEINLTKDLPGDKIFGGWSPDGQWIVFGRYTDNGDGITTDSKDATTLAPIEVWVMRSDGSQKTLLPFTSGPNEIEQIGWSSDSKQMLAACQVGNPMYGMCLTNMDNFTVTQLPSYGRYPTFSPNGKSYAWLDMGQTSLYVSSIEASKPLALEKPLLTDNESFRLQHRPINTYVWMADSHHILYEMFGVIFSASLDGIGTSQFIFDVENDVDRLFLSPNERFLLAYSSTPYVIDLESKKAMPLVQGYYYLWSPDNQLIAIIIKSKRSFVVDLITRQFNPLENLNWSPNWSNCWVSSRNIQP